MLHLFGFSWSQALAPHSPVLEILLRGSITYLVLFLLLRIIPKREGGRPRWQ